MFRFRSLNAADEAANLYATHAADFFDYVNAPIGLISATLANPPSAISDHGNRTT